jgi:hypothetical protein
VIRKNFPRSFSLSNRTIEKNVKKMNVLRKNVTRKNTGSSDYLIRPARGNSLQWTVVIIGIVKQLLAASPARTGE